MSRSGGGLAATLHRAVAPDHGHGATDFAPVASPEEVRVLRLLPVAMHVDQSYSLTASGV